MKKIYSLVLMAAVLLIGTNAWAAELTVGTAGSGATYTSLSAAFAAANDGDVIKMLTSLEQNSTIWIGETTMAATSGTGKKLTLDLNGKVLTRSANVRLFDLTHGKLVIKSSQTGGQILDNNPGKYDSSKKIYTYNDLILVCGSTLKDSDPRYGDKYYSHLVIEEGVTLNAKQNVLTVDNVSAASGHSIAYGNLWNSSMGSNAGKEAGTRVYGKSNGVANGVRVEVKGTLNAQKYGIKVNGNVVAPKYYDKTDGQAKLYTSKVDGYTVAEGDTAYSPFVYVHSSAVITTNESAASATAIYASGYGRWLIKGHCQGSTGLYAKSGKVDVVDALIESTNTAVNVPDGKTSGIDAGGSAIVIESNAAYAGQTEIVISGDSRIEAQSGYAIEETITTSNETKVEQITIQSGTIAGGDAGAMIVTQKTTEKDAGEVVSVFGGNVTGSVQQADEDGNVTIEDLATYIPENADVHTTTVVVDGKSTIIISGGSEDDIANAPSIIAADKDSIKWTGSTPETLQESKSFKYLEINNGVAQVLTVGDADHNVVLTVDRMILGADAQIIVNPGSKLIVKGNEGIIAPKTSNIILRNENGEQAIFLFNPKVISNRHPNATIEFITKSWYESSSSYQWERFAIPAYEALESISLEKTEDGIVYAQIAEFNNPSWTNLGFIGGSYVMAPSQFDKPFGCYNMLANRAQGAEAPVLKMAGALVGNINASLNVDMKWTPLANSYTAPIDVYQMLSALELNAQNVSKYIYIARPAGLGTYVWDPFDADYAADKDMKMKPMQAFILSNIGTEVEASVLNYKDMVYDPATSAGAPARRAAANNSAKLRIVVANEEGVWDNVKLKETANTGALEKYMNDDVNIYAMADEKYAIVAAEDLEDTYFGFSTVNGGNFTINFEDVEGRQFDLVDMENGAKVAVMEGASYNFTAAANTVADYRFKLVSRDNAPTAIENTEAVKSAKGIYTITGQYVGEMNVWNTLPAGVYVVNGEKLVK